MRMMNVGADSSTSFPKLSLSLASTHEDVREVQRLRYKVFVEAMGLETLKNHEGIERDEFDDVCDHLIVRDTRTLEVVGTYRVLSPRVLSQTGGFYSEQEFDLARLTNLRPRIMEAGRACIHPDYRSGGVIMMLWAGLAACMQREQAEYLIDKLGNVFDGIISGVTDWGIYVELVESKCEGMIRFQSIGKVKVDLEHYTVTDEMGNKIRLGDPIKIVVKSVDLEKKQVDFTIF